MKNQDVGSRMLALAEELWPVNRSLSGPGTKKTLERIREELPDLEIKTFKSGAQVFDWQVPKEWSVDEAYIETPTGERICDFSHNNLHLVGYSIPVEMEISLEKLQNHLYSLPAQPDAIPYVTSYYEEKWGFCISDNQRKELVDGSYRVVIRSKLFEGFLHYGELLIPGKTDREVYFSTYVCHPSMANNELSGPIVATFLAKKLRESPRHYSTRFVFLPETIGSLAYMAENLDSMKRRIVAGYVLTCVGDENQISFLPSRAGNSVSDKIALQALKKLKLQFREFTWLDRGSDERQYCSPGADLPITSVMRSKYGEYPEYHTSLDKLGSVVTSKGLSGSLEIYLEIMSQIEGNRYPIATNIGEPQMGRRGLYPQTSIKGAYGASRSWMDVLSMSDGRLTLEEIAIATRIDLSTVREIVSNLENQQLVRI